MTKITTEETIQKFQMKHSDRYDYSLVEYRKAREKVTVVCRKHGPFEVTPNNHLSGYGCPSCTVMPFWEFVEEAKKIHGGEYDYREGENGKHEIVCKDHGSFLMNKWVHLVQKSKCPKCAYVSRGDKARLGKDGFILKARETHGDLYDYSKVEYKGAHTKVAITCKTHGDFNVTPANHWNIGVGCPSCFKRNQSKSEKKIAGWLLDRGIHFEAQKSFEDLYHKKKHATLKFDFYVPERNLLIEYDGEGHFLPITFSKKMTGEEQLAITKERDRLKTEYARKNGYDLLRIAYDEDVAAILQQTFPK